MSTSTLERPITEDLDIDAIDAAIDEELKAHVTLAIQTELLKKLAGKVERAFSKRSVQDMYKMIYLNIEENKLTFRGINNDYLTEAIAYQNEDGSNFKVMEGHPSCVCFPGDKFITIVKKLIHQNTEIIINGELAVIKSGRPSFELNIIDGHQFPSTPDLGSDISAISIHPQVLSMMYNRTMYAASTKETRPVLTGVHHMISGTMFKCVATDAYRLAQFVYELDQEYEEISTTVPIAALNEVKKHLDVAETEVTMHIYENQIVYEFTDTTIYARVLGDSYPNIARLIFNSEQAGSSTVMKVSSIRELINNSTVYNLDQPIIIRLKPEVNQLRVNSREEEVGAFQQDLATTEGKGEDVILAVNVRYLQEALARYNGDDYINLVFMPSISNKPAGMQPFRIWLRNGDEDCTDLFVPVRSSQINYTEEIEIDDFQGVPEFEFNPFELDFGEIE